MDTVALDFKTYCDDKSTGASETEKLAKYMSEGYAFVFEESFDLSLQMEQAKLWVNQYQTRVAELKLTSEGPEFLNNLGSAQSVSSATIADDLFADMTKLGALFSSENVESLKTQLEHNARALQDAGLYASEKTKGSIVEDGTGPQALGD